jgi:succinate-acetate transporter protein
VIFWGIWTLIVTGSTFGEQLIFLLTLVSYTLTIRMVENRINLYKQIR